MKSWLVYSSAVLFAHLACSPSAQAFVEKRYVAAPTESQWLLTVNTPLECRLVHPIPNFGDAHFSSYASKKIVLDFELKMRRPMGATRDVSLISMPPPWRPGEHAERVSQLKFFQQFDGYIGGQTAWGLLSELERGRYPTFSYQDWQSRDQRIEVALSSVLFQPQYQAFSQCVANLLPYSFEDIAFTILHYERHGNDLTKASQQRLAQIAEYVRYNEDVDLVLISTYTDSVENKSISQDVTERRAESMRVYFQDLGLADERIEVQGFGKRRPIADNATPLGKDKNRRVVISLGRTQL
ncbi:OmpA family protein [Vibrio sp. SM6]|uniref:OmpA family protein n=1 Tax=Vibrio agarilyticus TaxID=2726741 RepID=A0A7X8TU03_9VIBR|nr:OmpA family protein [Vibrio agarilyticus]NLS14492.1 OmpA family protein [Vibrio agarilyticus]